MLSELIEGCEDYFSFNDNLLVLMSLIDILKLAKYCNDINLPENYNLTQIEKYKVVEVKIYIAPMIDDIITRLVRILSSEDQIISLIYNEKHEILLNWHEVIGLTVIILEILLQFSECGHTPKHVLTSILKRAKIFNLLMGIILRFYDLAGPELAHSFRLYNSIAKMISSRQELVGGIVYFLFIVCFETFTPGLNDFLRISLNDLKEIFDLDPTLSLWNPEMRLIQIVLELHNRCDQHAIDCLLKFMLFEMSDISTVFSDILCSSMEISESIDIPLKLIKKYGNGNLLELFNNSYGAFKQSPSVSTVDTSVWDLRETWMSDFISLFQSERV